MVGETDVMGATFCPAGPSSDFKPCEDSASRFCAFLSRSSAFKRSRSSDKLVPCLWGQTRNRESQKLVEPYQKFHRYAALTPARVCGACLHISTRNRRAVLQGIHVGITGNVD